MHWLAEQSLWALLVMAAAAMAALAAIGTWAGRHWFGETSSAAGGIAGPMMPALGACFAVLAAFGVAGASADQRGVKGDVAKEANAAARLAWASTGRGAAGAAVRADLDRYLAAAVDEEWSQIGETTAGQGPAFDELSALQRTVRTLARTDSLDTAARAELLGAVDELASLRRGRFTASEPVEWGIVALLAVSGALLVLNASVLLLGRSPRAAAVMVSLVTVTSLSLATVIALGGPFSGSFKVSPQPLVDVRTDLQTNRFEPGS